MFRISALFIYLFIPFFLSFFRSHNKNLQISR